MSVALDTTLPTIAGHTFVLRDRAEGMLNLHIALGGSSLAAFAQTLAKLDGVRVIRGPEWPGRERCYIVHCLGFKMLLPTPAEGAADFALALVSRTPQAALAVMSDLGSILERLMSEPPRPVDTASSRQNGSRLPLRRAGLDRGGPLARRTELRRKTPLARSRFKKS